MRRGMRWLGVLALAGLIGCGGESRHNSDPQSSSQPSGPRATQAPSPPEPAAPEPPALPEPPASRRVQAGPYTADAGR
ncbi:MAG: serine/threonine protein kinase, partial [Sandaracinaceae bacterium]|nr:serine/threonine protein kinase [Sandaracinaceae bacterium]